MRSRRDADTVELISLSLSLLMDNETSLLRIRALNDSARQNPATPCKIFVTSGIDVLPEADKAIIWRRVCSFNDFTPENDPYGKHDFGSFEHNRRAL